MTLTLSILSFFSSFVLISIFQKGFIKKNIFDKINDRSSHSVASTRTGGLALFVLLFVISCISYVLKIDLFDYSIMVPLSILFIVGLYDDIYDVDFKLKFVFQVIAAKIIIDSGLVIDNLHGLFGIDQLSRITAQLLTLFIIVAIINAINFIDGIDSLAILIVTFFLIGFEFFIETTSPFISLTCMILSAFVPLLYFNLRKDKKVFLGDSGSLFLGGIISIYVLTIMSNEYLINDMFDLNKIIFVYTLLMYPIIDIIRVVAIRIYNGRSPFSADKNHIHHFLVKKINSHVVVSLIIIFLTFINLIIFQFLFN